MQSFQGLNRWLEEVKNHSEKDAIIILVGNQCDKESEREVSKDQGARFAKENGINFFIETSAKTNEGVVESFVTASKMIYKR